MQTASLLPKRISTIGGGLSAITTCSIMALLFKDAQEKLGYTLAPLVFDIHDSTGAFGRGTPYDSHDTNPAFRDVQRLNQGACDMSPFDSHRNHFVDYCNGDRYAFFPRAFYGDYITRTFDTIQESLSEPSIGVQFNLNKVHVTSVTRDNNEWYLHDTNNTLHAADRVVIATGHQPAHNFDNFKNHPHFFDYDFSIESLAQLVAEDPAAPVGIAGTGARFVDDVLNLRAAGHTGPVYAFSRNTVTPWAYNPADYDDDREPYTPTILTPDRLKELGRVSAKQLNDLFKAEIKTSGSQNYKLGHVLGSLDIDGLSEACASKEEFEKFHSYFMKLYGNPTPPDSAAYLEELKVSGRLHYIKADVSEETLQVSPQGFHVTPLDTSQQVPALKFLFNGAYHTRNPFASPIIQQAVKNEWLSVKHDAIADGLDPDNRLYVVGVPINATKIGVGTHRKKHEDTAKDILLSLYPEIATIQDWHYTPPSLSYNP